MRVVRNRNTQQFDEYDIESILSIVETDDDGGLLVSALKRKFNWADTILIVSPRDMLDNLYFYLHDLGIDVEDDEVFQGYADMFENRLAANVDWYRFPGDLPQHLHDGATDIAIDVMVNMVRELGIE